MPPQLSGLKGLALEANQSRVQAWKLSEPQLPLLWNGHDNKSTSVSRVFDADLKSWVLVHGKCTVNKLGRGHGVVTQATRPHFEVRTGERHSPKQTNG
jgi:hypothetical protein